MISAEGPLPFPRDRFSWVIAAILFAGLMLFYYGSLYSRLEDAYREGFVYTRDRQSTRDNTLPVIRAALPRYLSGMTDRKLFISVTNPESASGAITVTVIPVLSIDTETPSRYYVFLTSVDVEGNTSQNGILTFESVPRGATIAQEATLRVMGPQEPDDTITFKLAIIRPDGTREPLELEKSTTMTVDPVRSLLQNLVAFVLLPPWANGFIPLMALFSVYLFGLGEARRRWPYWGWRLWFWGLLLFVWANLLVFTAAKFAISILNEESYTRPILTLLLFLIISLFAWWWGHKEIGKQDRQDTELIVRRDGGQMTIHIDGVLAAPVVPITLEQPSRPSLGKRGRKSIGGFVGSIGQGIARAGSRMGGDAADGAGAIALNGGSAVVLQNNTSVSVGQAAAQQVPDIASVSASGGAPGSPPAPSLSAPDEIPASQRADEAAQTPAQSVAQAPAANGESQLPAPTPVAAVVGSQFPAEEHPEAQVTKPTPSGIEEGGAERNPIQLLDEEIFHEQQPHPAQQMGPVFDSPPPTGLLNPPSEGAALEAALKLQESIHLTGGQGILPSAVNPESDESVLANAEYGIAENSLPSGRQAPSDGANEVAVGSRAADIAQVLDDRQAKDGSDRLPDELANNPPPTEPSPPQSSE